ncbi:hypothetical protein MG293_020845 [Ovis ammon polii]|uniref:Uncharacterized protein n=1 Tax=Ovis ammon polii TaxID=230172 RepID=A0AAD4TME0_OVIAM|nr:hypothetical protein MG293_020845 [Ovis ammon polii]
MVVYHGISSNWNDSMAYTLAGPLRLLILLVLLQQKCTVETKKCKRINECLNNKAEASGQQQSVLVMLCMAGTLQPPVATPGEDATFFRVEAGEDSKVQVDGVMAGIRRVFQLLAEDIIEDVEVVPDK